VLLHYLGKQETRKLRLFLPKCCMFFHQKTLRISPGQSWTTLHCQNDRLGAPDRTQEWSTASCCLLLACSVLAKSVTLSVAVQKVRVVLRQAWSKSQWTVLVGYLTISTNIRRYQTHHRWQFFSFRKTAHKCIVCNTIQLSENVIFMFPHFDRWCRSTS